MKRNVAAALLGTTALAALTGCAYQDTLTLPDLGPSTRSSQPPYPGYRPYYDYGYNTGYGSGYRPGYDPYDSYYYGSRDPRYYAPGVVYVPYPRYGPVSCADVNHDGHCDQPPPPSRSPHAAPAADPPVDKHNGVERPPRARDDAPGEGPHLRRGGVDRYTTPAPPSRIVPPAPRPSQVRAAGAGERSPARRTPEP